MYLRYIAISGSSGKGEFAVFEDRFRSNSRFICNYLSKEVRKLKLNTFPYKMLNYYPSPSESSIRIWDSDVINCKLFLSPEEIDKLNKMKRLEDRYEYYFSFLERGYRFVSESIPLPVDSILGLHDQFRKGGYRNEWLFKKKMIREYGLYVFLKCYFTTFDFHLELEAYDLKQTRLIAKDIIFQSFPDEICFSKDFRSIQVEGSKLQILNFLGKAEMAVDLEALTQGRVVVDYIDDDFLNWEECKESTRKAIERITW